MSGRRINDHSFWGGKAPSGKVFPDGNKTQSYMSAEGAGEVGSAYPDTTEDISSDQKAQSGKMKSNRPKAGYRY